jgi:hypothetical protein
VADTRKHTIIDNCLAAIGAITHGATYERTVRTISRNVLSLPESPVNDTVWVESTTQTKEPLASALSLVTLVITFGAIVESSDLGKACDDIEADIERALAVDVTRGGYAIDTRVIHTEDAPLESGAPLAGVRVDVEIKYRHADGNPYAAS